MIVLKGVAFESKKGKDYGGRVALLLSSC